MSSGSAFLWSRCRSRGAAGKAVNNLVATLGVQGQLEEAAAMMKEVLEKRRRILGEEHPKTRSATKDLAILTSMRNA